MLILHHDQNINVDILHLFLLFIFGRENKMFTEIIIQ